MTDKASIVKRKIMLKIAQDDKIRELINNNDIEYPEDLIGQNIFPYLKIDNTIYSTFSII